MDGGGVIGVAMARKLSVLFAGTMYHVTFRGNARQAIFGDDGDRERLTGRVGESAEDFGVRIYQYGWMGNHGHLLVETPAANLSAFMHKVQTAYTVYFNLRHRRAGHLMQGRFNSTLVQGGEYLLKLSRYIHLNPVFVGRLKAAALEARLKALPFARMCVECQSTMEKVRPRFHALGTTLSDTGERLGGNENSGPSDE